MFGLSITVDVDGEAGLPDGGRGHEERLTARSERAYGLTRGLPGVLRVLDEFAAAATFYVPGVIAIEHPDLVRPLAVAPHEIGHHGHVHRRPDTMTAAEQRRDVEEGLAALATVCGQPVHGYRAPGWELTPVTLSELAESGFAWDSSLMGDDRPYRIAGGRLVELPVHWSLDDAPHFAATSDPAGLLAVWIAELHAAQRESRHVTLTLHPEILGRPHRLDVLRRVLDTAAEHGVRSQTHGSVVARA